MAAAEAAINALLDSAGLGNVPGLAGALAAAGCQNGTIQELRSLPEEAIQAALQSLSLRQMTLRKAQAVLAEMRSHDGGQAIHRGFDFNAENAEGIDKILTPRGRESGGGGRPSTGGGSSMASPPLDLDAITAAAAGGAAKKEKAFGQPPKGYSPATASGVAQLQAAERSHPAVPSFTMPPPQEEMAIFTPRMEAGPGAAPQFEGSAPIFTPRTMAIRQSGGPVPTLDVDAPIFTPRTMAAQHGAAGGYDDAPIFTPRGSLAGGGMSQATMTAMNQVDDADDAAPIFTPRGGIAGGGATGAMVDDVYSMDPEFDEDAPPMFTPRTNNANLQAFEELTLQTGGGPPLDEVDPIFTPRALVEPIRPDVSDPPAVQPIDVGDDAGGAPSGATKGKKSKKPSPEGKAPKGKAKGKAKADSPQGEAPSASTDAKVKKDSHIGVKLPQAKGSKGKESKKSSKNEKMVVKLVVRHGSSSEDLGALTTELTDKMASGTLQKNLLEPAFSALNVRNAIVQNVKVDGHPVDVSIPIKSLKREDGGEVEVLVILAADSAIPRSFKIEIISHDEEPVASKLVPIPQMPPGGPKKLDKGSQWIMKTIDAELVQPALDAADLHGARVKKVTVDGKEIKHQLEDCYTMSNTPENVIRVIVTLDKGAGPKPFLVDILSYKGETLASMETKLSATLVSKPLLSGLILPALERLQIKDVKRIVEQLVVSVDGMEVDHKRVEKARAVDFVAPGGAPTHVVVTLPAGASQSHGSVLFQVLLHHGQRPEPMCSLTAEVKGKWLTNMTLMKAVVTPACNEFVKMMRSRKVKVKTCPGHGFLCYIDGRVVDPMAVTSTYANDEGEVRLQIILPEHAIESPAQFDVDIFDASDKLVSQISTRCVEKWLDKPMGKSVVDEVLHSEGLDKVGWSKVVVDGEPIDATTARVSFFTSRAAANGTDLIKIVVTLNPMPPGKQVLSKQQRAMSSLCSSIFTLEIYSVEEPEAALHRMETQPKQKWLEGKSIEAAIVQPGLKAKGLQNSTIDRIFVEGQRVESMAPAAALVPGDGEPVRIQVILSEIKDAASQPGLIRRTTSSLGGLRRGSSSKGGSSSAPQQQQFTIEIRKAPDDLAPDSPGEHIATLDTKLSQKWLEKPIQKSLVDPALKAENLDKIGCAIIEVNGERVDPGAKVSSLLGKMTTFGDGEIPYVVLTLKASKKAVVAASSANAKAIAKADGYPFIVELRTQGAPPARRTATNPPFTHSHSHTCHCPNADELIVTLETKLKKEFLKKTIMKSIVEPVLRAQQMVQSKIVYDATVDGERIDPTKCVTKTVIGVDANGVLDHTTPVRVAVFIRDK